MKLKWKAFFWFFNVKIKYYPFRLNTGPHIPGRPVVFITGIPKGKAEEMEKVEYMSLT